MHSNCFSLIQAAHISESVYDIKSFVDDLIKVSDANLDQGRISQLSFLNLNGLKVYIKFQ